MAKAPPWQCPSTAPVPPQGAPRSPGQLGTPRARPVDCLHPRPNPNPGAFRLLSLGNMLSVGVMLGGGLLHLLPEAVEGAKEESFPFPYLAFSLGLLLPLCIEQLLHAQQHCQRVRVRVRVRDRVGLG